VTDAFNAHNERFGDAGLRSMLTKAPPGPAAAGEMLVQQVRNHAAGRSQFDDITMIAFGRNKGFAPEIPGNSLGNPYLTSPPKLNACSF